MVIEPLTYLTNGTDLYQFVMTLPEENAVLIEDVREGQNITLTDKQFRKLHLKTLEEHRAERDG